VGRNDQVLFLAKPFDAHEVEELALTLAQKYAARRLGQTTTDPAFKDPRAADD
jgi:hypothetical protein